MKADSWLKKRVQVLRIALFWFAAGATLACGQTLAFPHRATSTLTGSEFAKQIELTSLLDREAAIRHSILAGAVPDFLRELRPVHVTNVGAGKTNFATFHVTPDYLAVGSDEDYLLTPMTPETAQLIADALGCTLPTRKMVDAIYAAATVKLQPIPIPPSPAMTTPAVFAQHNEMVRTERATQLHEFPLGALVAGHKKDVVISARLAGVTNKVAIYGWQQTNGVPIQPLYAGHTSSWVDYSHGIRLVQQQMTVNGQPTTVANVLANPELAGLLSDEGMLTNPRYPTNDRSQAESESSRAAWPEHFGPGAFPGELVRELQLPNGVRVVINTAASGQFATNRPVRLIFYALPNGNTIEQTVGKKLAPGDDWHFNIQHIGAQTRFLRQVLTNQNVVVAYLENSLKSWPAWRREHGNDSIPPLLATVQAIFARWPVEVVLTGHSGGGSLTFGYLNTVTNIPADVGRIAFLDSNYAYTASNHLAKLVDWLNSSAQPRLCVLAYNDAGALLYGKPFVSAAGGTWGHSHAMLADLGRHFRFANQTKGDLKTSSALNGRVQFLLLENSERRILHTVQVERNGFIHALLAGTIHEGQGYEYMGTRAYEAWIQNGRDGR